MSDVALKGHAPLPRNAKLLRVYALFWGMIFLVPVIVPFYRDEIGLTFNDFLLGEAVFCAVVILMEIPTGWVSDVWTRKRTLMAATLVNIAGYVILWHADSLADTMIAQGTIGLGVSLMSGTDSALLYDSFLEKGQEDLYRREQGFLHGLKLYMVGASSLAGGFLYQMQHFLPLALTILTSIIALGVIFFMREPERHKQAVDKHPFADMIKTMRYALHGHKEIAGIILLSGGLFATTKTLLWAQQPYYMMLEIPEHWFGVLVATGFLLGGMGGQFGHVLDRFESNRKVLMSCLALVFLGCVLGGFFPGYYIVPLLLAGSMIWGFGWPRVQDAINKRVDSSRRATILSTASLMINLLAIPLFVFTGYLSDHGGITVSLQGIAGVLALVGLVSGGLLYRRQRA